ncbi:hypothetical protein, partial [Klebsiella pneumoniae]|uniref:hypothetical protein n=1 Tax=Klebsiella pneumoniae TaxID=573 RepID=UPI001A9366F4
KRAYCLKTQPATGETYPKSDLFNKAYIFFRFIFLMGNIGILKKISFLYGLAHLFFSVNYTRIIGFSDK